ncbi:protein of unknown function (DUF4345) [Nocardia amikacinitolerans]|uniref:DUF4345 domain-containing protein n=1 Tax=Nocardia amikacinitolerans TaxID=756689 RepID=UPI0008374C83|nr:DUF4345 domain-containing protein [Nocardia amikacinitolerans]MCP2316806.1 protein of unknown function (DUF4345) [Nocardia amikacinitolerans]
MAKLLKILAMTMGVACVAIGFFHLALGIDSVPDMGSSGVTADSQSRFFGAIFVGYGAAWIWTARRTPIPAVAVRWLAGIFLLGAVGRVLSVAVYGWPHWFQIVLTVIEFVFPPVYFWLADADEKRVAGERVAVS